MKRRSILATIALALLLAAAAAAIPLTELRATLWPRSPHDIGLMVSSGPTNARRIYGVDASGKVLDVGAVRAAADGSAEVLTADGNGTWVRYDPGDVRHVTSANNYSRIGAGWSWGNNSVHNSAAGWFITVNGRPPTAMENTDIQYSATLYKALCLGAGNAPEFCSPPPRPATPPAPPVNPPAPPAPPPVVPPTPAQCHLCVPPAPLPCSTIRKPPALPANVLDSARKAATWSGRVTIGPGWRGRFDELLAYVERVQAYHAANDSTGRLELQLRDIDRDAVAP